jgi:2-polyprenyl-6-methoxyphenol hydroxylase-like FAD-dependent oxidoreductase
VLEKHGDFLRDFRGDTVRPSTLDVMHELGLLEAFLARPHDKARELKVRFSDGEAVIADFSRLRTRCGFRLMGNAQVLGVVEIQGRVTGVRVSMPQGETRFTADLVVAADGRRSILREAAGLKVRNLGAPMDALWMRIARQSGDRRAAAASSALGACSPPSTGAATGSAPTSSPRAGSRPCALAGWKLSTATSLRSCRCGPSVFRKRSTAGTR